MSSNPAVELADTIFCFLAGDGIQSPGYEDSEKIRSMPYSDTVDVKIGEQWYRISIAEIDEPISQEAYDQATL